MFGLGFGELIVIFLIALIFIGPKKLPEVAKGLGKGIRDFQNAAKGLTDQLQDTGDSHPKKVADASQQAQPEVLPEEQLEKENPSTEKKETPHS